MTNHHLVLNVVSAVVLQGLLAWHIVVLLRSIWEPGARFYVLAKNYPPTGEPEHHPGLGGMTPGSGMLLPFSFWYNTVISFDDAGMHAEHKGQRALVPWKHLRLAGSAPLLLVVEVVPEKTRFAFMRPYVRRRVVKKLKQVKRANATHT